MSLRDYLERLEAEQRLVRVQAEISKDFEIAGVLKKLEPRPMLFENVRQSALRVAGNLFCSKAAFADYFQISVGQIISRLSDAIRERSMCEKVGQAACQEVIETHPDLDKLPLMRHCSGDGGPYISAGIMIARHPVYGQNMDFHRCMQISKNELAVRVVRGRHFDRFLSELGQVEAAICIGSTPNLLAAAATSVEIGIDELEIANALEPVEIVHAHSIDVWVPANVEVVIEGVVYRDRRHAEGPFVDLTGAYDAIRQEPVFEVTAITHRKDAIWQALLPGALEHKLLMGMPREPTIYQKVNGVVRCLDVNVNPGGCSWLHAIVQIDKQTEGDGKKAIQAAFAGHNSCKHVFVVDKDIDIYNPLAVEWAMATRFQGDVDLVMLPKERGSSLDPSAEAGTHLTTKLGFDMTKPVEPGEQGSKGHAYDTASFPEVDLGRFVPSKQEAGQ